MPLEEQIVLVTLRGIPVTYIFYLLFSFIKSFYAFNYGIFFPKNILFVDEK